MTCLICLIPADMGTPVIGRLLYWHVNRAARRGTARNLARNRGR